MTRAAPSTIKQSLQKAHSALRDVADNSRLEADILLCHALDKPRSYIHAWPDKTLAAHELDAFQRLVADRARGTPIAYLTGYREFWGLNLRVSPDTLIPRPETEHLVEAALARIPKRANWQIADLGTGSGAIALALASERPACEIFATDISAAALDIARKNAEALGLNNIRFIEGSWCKALGGKTLAMICSNPPYIDPDDPHLHSGDLRFEPPEALRAYEHGLADLTQIIQCSPQYLQAGGWLLLEHGYNQGLATLDLLKNAGFIALETVKDYAPLERISLGKIPQ